MAHQQSVYQRWRRRIVRISSLFRGYLWFFYLAVLVFLIYYFRLPLRAYDKLESMLSISYFNNLTPKFYVALTGTSSLVSGIILIFEWYYFKNNAIDNAFESEDGSDADDILDDSKTIGDLNDYDDNINGECKVVWRNPMALFRGADYQRYTRMIQRIPLTFYDLNLSAQDHQTFFCCDSDAGRDDLEIMSMVWRERDSTARISEARRALSINSDCVPALILIAEEECQTVTESEEYFRRGLKIVEGICRKNQSASYPDPESQQKTRDINLLVYIRRRIAMCARRLGRVRESIKIMRDLMKEFPTLNVLVNIHENLIEALLEQQAYADATAVLAKYDNYDAYARSATSCFTSALLKVRGVADKFDPDTMRRKGLSSAEVSAVEAIHRAVEFNPHIPLYLLEMKPVTLPPEHILKRGDSEAVAYAFWHLQHWKRITFRLLPNPTQRGHLFYPYPACIEAADRELLPSYHEVSVYPKKEFPLWTVFASLISFCVAIFAIVFHQYPDETITITTNFLHWLLKSIVSLYTSFVDYMYQMVPENLSSFLASKSNILSPPTVTPL